MTKSRVVCSLFAQTILILGKVNCEYENVRSTILPEDLEVSSLKELCEQIHILSWSLFIFLAAMVYKFFSMF